MEVRERSHSPLKPFSTKSKEMVSLQDSGTMFPFIIVPQSLKILYFNFRPFKLKMSSTINSYYLGSDFVADSHMLETSLSPN